MKYLITGTTSGIGKDIVAQAKDVDFWQVNRKNVDLDDIQAVKNLVVPKVDGAILNAGHDIGGGVSFTQHNLDNILQILNCNFLSNVILCHKILQSNPNAILLFVTSTNLNKSYPKNLAYNLSKFGVKSLIDLLKIEYPNLSTKEARVHLTKTQFNDNRHKPKHKPVNDLYANKHMTSSYVAQKILELLDSDQNFMEINTNA
jgi:short-subunit dehydrogenase